VKPVKGAKRATPVSRTAPPGKPVIKQFIRSPNCSSRNVGTKIDKIVLHCTEGSLASALAEFQRSDSRKVSAHYVIDRNGDIYQMVNDADCANHCMGANSGSIGIEHVGSETDALAAPQAAASAALIRWLLQEHQIPRTNIFGHDFTPGYSRPGGTSCPDQALRPGALTNHETLLGSRLTCELTSRSELAAPAQAFFLRQICLIIRKKTD
jgi:N-acetyl-anhydromuramyl-L-alanine amidase AmpD